MTFVSALVMTATVGFWDPHVRATAQSGQRLVDGGAQRSATVRALIDRLEASSTPLRSRVRRRCSMSLPWPPSTGVWGYLAATANQRGSTRKRRSTADATC